MSKQNDRMNFSEYFREVEVIEVIASSDIKSDLQCLQNANSIKSKSTIVTSSETVLIKENAFQHIKLEHRRI